MDKVSTLCLGTAQLGMDYGIANEQGIPDDGHALQIIEFALSQGIHTFDTAQAYGKSEAVLGNILSFLKPAFPLKIVTKISPDIDHIDPEQMRQALTGSLRRLKQKTIYGYMLHDEKLLSLWNKGLKSILKGFQSEGLIKKIGISLYTPQKALECLGIDGIDLIQIPSNILDRRFSNMNIFESARNKNKTVFVRSIFLQGLLLMDPDKLSPEMDYAVPTLKKIDYHAKRTGLTKQQLAMAYAKHAFQPSRIIVGIETLDQLKENLKLWNQTCRLKDIMSIERDIIEIDKRIIDPSKWDKLNILAILQARTSSSRLPGKVMKPILGKPMLELQIERILRSRRIEKLVVATSRNKEDNPIEDLCKTMGIDCYRGDLNNVLDRFYQVARTWKAENIVRLTGDCPLSDPEKIDQLIDFFMKKSIDYASNCEIPKLPDGLDAEILTFNALKKTWQNAQRSDEKEHVTLYINNHSDLFRQDHLIYDKDYSHMRWTVDEPEDFIFVQKIYENLYPSNPLFNTKDIMAFLNNNPHLTQINARFKRNEGFINSSNDT